MTLTTKQALERWILGYINVTGVGCITNTSGSRDWLVKNWGFISDLIQTEHLTSPNTNSSAIGATVIINTTIRDTLLNSIIGKLKPLFPVFTSANFTSWFENQLPPLLPSITGPDLASIPTNITCESYQAIVKGFDRVILNLTISQLAEFYNFGKNILTLQLNSSGSAGIACAVNTTGSRDWIRKNFLKSLRGFLYNDLLALNKNFSGFEVLDLLTPELLAGLTVHSDALNNTDKIIHIVDALAGRHIAELTAYLTHFVNATRMMNITTFQNTTVRDQMLSKIMQLLEPLFPSFNTTDYIDWFQTRLSLLLPSITGKELSTIPTNITCESYQAIVKGFDRVVLNLTISQLAEFYNFGKNILTLQLNSSGSAGIACAVNTTGSRDWIRKNFLKSLRGFSYNDLLALNKNFSGFEVLDLLTPELLAGLTVNSDALNNTDKIIQIVDALAGRHIAELTAYLTHFVNATRMMNITTFQNTTVRDQMLSKIMQLLEPLFPSFNTTDYIDWFQTRLSLLLPSITGKELSTIPTNITCESYQAIVKGFDRVVLDLTISQLAEFYNFGKNILTLQLNSSGSAGIACAVNTTGSRDWIRKNFLKSLRGFSYDDLLALNKNFSGFEVLDLLTPELLAGLTVHSDVLNDTDKIIKIVDALAGRHIGELTAYLTHFVNATRMMNITTFQNTTVRDQMLSKIMQLLEPLFPSFNTTDYIDWFQTRLSLLLPSITGKELSTIPTNITCESYQAIVKGFDRVVLNLTISQLAEFYNFGKNILTLQLNSSGSAGIACAVNMTGSRDWIRKNFLESLRGFLYNDLLALNKNFSGFEVLDLLTPELLAGLTVNSDALNNTNKIIQIVDALTGRHIGELTAYLTHFANATRMMNITTFQNTTVRDQMLSKIMQLLEPLFPSFNTTDYIDWFQTRLSLLLPSITGKELSTIPTNITCESYQAIIQGLGDLYLSLSKSQHREICNFSKNFLTFQLSSAVFSIAFIESGGLWWAPCRNLI
ncbi:uncharacterized protein [Heptranchias perlo]|uniref:uncharacterized protein n=1 Tax=Heptranchias perlo TaxID=212740 RepID=UPI00355A7A57